MKPVNRPFAKLPLYTAAAGAGLFIRGVQKVFGDADRAERLKNEEVVEMRRGVKRKRVPKSWRRHKKQKRDVHKVRSMPSQYRETKRTYAKKAGRMSKRAQRAAKFVRKVKNIVANTTGLKSAIIDGNFIANTALGQQNVVQFMLNGGALASNPDLDSLLGSIDTGDKNNVTLKLHTAELTCYITNANAYMHENAYTFNVATGAVPAHDFDYGSISSGSVLYAKAYHVMARLDADNGNLGSNFLSAWAATLLDENVLGAPLNTANTVNTIGCNPFDAPNFCTQFKILGIEEFTLQPGQTHVLRLFSKNWRWLQGNRIEANAFVKGVTEGFIVIFQGSPLYSSGELDSINITGKSVRRYHFRHIQDDGNAGGNI